MTRGFGPAIKERREKLGMLQSELADRAGMARSHLSEIERGKIQLPGADFRRRIAKALGMSHAELLVAAGELTAEEAGLGLAYRPPFDESDPRFDVIQDLRAIPNDEDIELILGLTNRLVRRRPRTLTSTPNNDRATADAR